MYNYFCLIRNTFVIVTVRFAMLPEAAPRIPLIIISLLPLKLDITFCAFLIDMT